MCVCSRHEQASELTLRRPDPPHSVALPDVWPTGRSSFTIRAPALPQTCENDASRHGVGISDAAEVEQRQRAVPGAGGSSPWAWGPAVVTRRSQGTRPLQRQGAALLEVRLGLETPPHTHTYCHPVIEAATVPPGHVGLCCERVRKPRACPPSALGQEPP